MADRHRSGIASAWPVTSGGYSRTMRVVHVDQLLSVGGVGCGNGSARAARFTGEQGPLTRGVVWAWWSRAPRHDSSSGQPAPLGMTSG
jgi:hypothetical protein